MRIAIIWFTEVKCVAGNLSRLRTRRPNMYYWK